jgi:hypothetical protein
MRSTRPYAKSGERFLEAVASCPFAGMHTVREQ